MKSITEIHAEEEEVTEGMIETFLKRRHHLNDERINTVSENLERYKKDLWFLSWALKAYKPEKNSVEEEEIYEKVKESIEDISTGAEDVFLPLSVFYRFEIPIEERFLTEQLGVEINIIEQLINLSEITETEEIGKRKVFSLNHSSIADLYFRTYQSYPDFGRNVKRIFEQGDDDWEYPLFYRYINSAPMDSFDILNHLGCYSIKEGKTLIGELIEDNETKFSIEKAIGKEVSVHKIAEYLENMVHEEYEELAKKFVKTYIDTLLSKIEINCVPHNDVWEIGLYVGIIAIGGKEVQSKLFDVVSPKIEKEENVGKIGTFVIWIRDAWADWEPTNELARKLVNQNIDTLLSKIEKEDDGGNIGVCIHNISRIDPEVALQIINHKIDTFLSKISITLQEVSAEKPIPNIGFFLQPTPPLDLEEKIIQRVVNEVRKIVNNIGVDNLSSRIEQEEDIETIGDLVDLIRSVNIQLAFEILNNHILANISLKIEKEKDLKRIGWCVFTIANVSEAAGLKLVDSVPSGIGKVEDLDVLSSYLARIEKYVSEALARKFVNRLNPKLREELLEKFEEHRFLYI